MGQNVSAQEMNAEGGLNNGENVCDLHPTFLKHARKTFEGHPKPNSKRIKSDQHVPMSFGLMRTRLGKPEPVTVKILIDTGSSKSSVEESLYGKLQMKDDKTTE